MSFTSDLLETLAKYLVANDVGVWNPDPTVPYGPEDVAIVPGLLPDQPDRAIALMPYNVSDDIATSDGVVGVQLRYRGRDDINDVLQIADSAFNALQGVDQLNFPGGQIYQVQRNSSTPLGPDSSLRLEYVENYYLSVWHPTDHRE